MPIKNHRDAGSREWNHTSGKGKQFRLWRFMVVLAVVALWLSSSPFARGQSTFGSIVGEAVDTSSGLLPGVTITVTREETGITREVTTGSAGTFNVPNLLLGLHTIKATLAGFKTWTRTGVIVRLNQSTTVDIILELGSVTETVEVTGTVPLLQTTDATVGHVVDERRIQNLPLNGRDFTQLTLLIPGAAPAALPGGFFVVGGQPVAVSGNRPDQNNYTLDGTYNNETFFKHYGLRPSVDAIAEFNIQTNISSARYGVGGAHVDLATRSGSNAFHGSAFEFLRNDVLDANDFFRNSSGVDRPAFRQNNFGATFGGPVFLPKYNGRNRTFFFVNYEGLRRSRESSILGTVPTTAMLSGDLSLNTDGTAADPIFNPFTTCGFGGNPACTDINGPDGTPDGVVDIFDLTRQPFLNNQIPASLIHPVAAQYAAIFYGNNPPNRVIPGESQNLINTRALRLRTDQLTIRGDHQIADSTNMFARFSLSDIPISEPLGLPTQLQTRKNSFRNMTISGTHVFNPSTILEIKYGYARDNIAFNVPYPEPGFQSILDAGLVGIPPKFFGFDFPLNLDTEGFTGAQMFVFKNGPDRNHQMMVNVMKIKGKHTVNIGAEIKRAAMFHDGQFANWTFEGPPTANPQSASGTGLPLASFLLGLPSNANRLFGNAALDGLATNYHFYLQDDIKLTSNLTMNIGMRYEWSQWFRFRTDNLAGFDTTIGQFVWAGFNPVNGQPPNTRRTFSDPDFNNFAPRLGFAYRLGDRTTIRTSYGIFYAGLMTWEASQNRGNWPYAIAQTLSGLNASFPTSDFANVFPTFDVAAVRPSSAHTNSRQVRWPYIQQWNLHIQRELAEDLLLEVGYMGNKGTKLSSFISANDPPPGPGVVGCPGVACGGEDLIALNNGTIPPHPRPFQNSDAISENFMANTSRYHALQAKLERRFTSGLSLLGSYAWSKNIDLVSTFSGGAIQDFRNRKASIGRADFDLRHNFVFSSLYQLPFGPGHSSLNSGPASKLLGGWAINSIISLRSGSPFNVRVGKDVANVGARSGPFDRPDLIGDPNLPESERTVQRWFNTDAFGEPAAFTFGNLGRNTMIGPSFKNIDFSLIKTTQITETHRIEFRAEFFNAFNNVNFSNPISNFSDDAFGSISSVKNTSREIQFALKYIF